jgi:hypothetical protein
MDDPAKTFQQHTIANFPIPAEFIAENSPTDKPKPELTVRNPTVVQDDKSRLLQRGKSVTVSKREMSEPPTPSKSNTERRKSIIRSIIKPLPSISTPSSVKKDIEKPAKQQMHQQSSPPVLVVPEISSASTTDTSEDEVESQFKRVEEDEGDINIDPRAKVVFAIGNNMFDLGHLDLEDNMDISNSGGKKPSRETNTSSGTSRRITTRRRQPSADLEAACNFSYQSLLEELGVYENNKSDKSEASQPKKNIDSKITSDGLPVVSLRSRRSQRNSRSIPPQQQQQQQQRNNQQRQQPIISMDNLTYHTSNNPSPVSTIPQQDLYHTSSNFNPQPRQQQQQQQPHYHQPQQPQQYYPQYSNHNPPPAHPISSANHIYHPVNTVPTTTGSEYYQPPTNVVHGVQPTLFWGKL